MANPLGGEPLHTYDGIPQGDPLSTLIFAAAMTLAITGALGDGTAVQNVSYIDDTLLLEAHDRLAARLRPTGLELQPTKTKVWAPNMANLLANPRLAHLERQNPSGGGLLIVGEALGADDEEAQVLGTSPFVQEHLRKITALVAQDCVRIQHLPDHLVAQEAGMQLGFALLQRTLPSRILHLLRGQATEHTAELCETLTTHMHMVLRNWLGHPALNAANWRLAHLPITAGGLGLPDLQALALAARTAALATIPNEGQLAAYKEDLLDREGPALLHQLQARLAHPVAELVGDLRHMPAGKSTRQLSRKLMHSIHQHSVRTLRRTEEDMSAAMRHAWARNRATDGGTAASVYTGQGAWLRATPGSTAHTITNEAFRFNVGHRLGLDTPGAGQRCRRPLRLGQGPICQGQLDVLGLHAAACARHTNRHRHDELRDHLAQYARSSGITATIEQARPADDAPRHARPMHTADVHLMDAEANTTWIDVMVTAAQPARSITDSLREAEQHKCREYGLGVPNPAVLHQGLVPFVIEQHGRPASCAQAVADYLIAKKARHMESTLGLDMVAAKRQAAQAFWSPISCMLAKAAYRSLAECQAFRAPDRPAIGAGEPRGDVSPGVARGGS